VTSEERRFTPGQIVFREGASSDLAYVLVSGRIEITKRTDEGEITLGKLRKGDILGEIGALTGQPRSATARALEHTTLRTLTRDELLQLLASDQGENLPLVLKLVDKIRSASDLVTDDVARARLFRPAPARTPWPLRLLPRFGRRQSARQKILDFLPEIVSLEERRPPAAASIILWTIALLLFTGAAWASMVSVDRVVTAQGKIATTGRHILVQPIELGVIRTIDVAAGQVVSKGQVLATLDPTFAEAELTASEDLLVSLNAEVVRLQAELSGEVPDHFAADPEVDALQRSLYDQRLANYQAGLRALDAELAEVRAQQAKNQANRGVLEDEVAVLAELSGMRRELLQRNAGSRAQYLETYGQELSLREQIARLDGEAPELEQREAALIARREGAVSQQRADTAAALQEAIRKRDSVHEELRKAERRSGLVQLQAPADAVVLEIAKLNVGSVIREAEPLFTLLPLNVPLEAQLEVNPRDIGRIRRADPVRIKLDALPFQRHGTLEGEVRLISEDAFEVDTPQGKTAAYRVNVDLGPIDLRDVPADFRLIPGMTLTAEIRIGERRLITYFLYPIIRAVDESFREP
jgi:membrane fusion protein, hemolysin D